LSLIANGFRAIPPPVRFPLVNHIGCYAFVLQPKR
jgi:hypothetical protein